MILPKLLRSQVVVNSSITREKLLLQMKSKTLCHNITSKISHQNFRKKSHCFNISEAILREAKSQRLMNLRLALNNFLKEK